MKGITKKQIIAEFLPRSAEETYNHLKSIGRETTINTVRNYRSVIRKQLELEQKKAKKRSISDPSAKDPRFESSRQMMSARIDELMDENEKLRAMLRRVWEIIKGEG